MTEQELRQLYSRICGAMAHVAIYYRPKIQIRQNCEYQSDGIGVTDYISVMFQPRADVPEDHLCRVCGRAAEIKQPKNIYAKANAAELLAAVQAQFGE